MKMLRKDEGFTLVELMVVVLIIGILVAIAVPVFLNASASAQAKSCQANQRTFIGALSTFNANAGVNLQIPAAGALMDSATFTNMFGNSATAVIKSVPTCPVSNGKYFVDTNGNVVSDLGTLAGGWVAAAHQLGK